MECLWRMYCYRRPAGYCNQQDPPVFYLRINPCHGFTDYYIPGAGFLEKYPEIYLGSKEESVVLFIIHFPLFI